jgi:hypothetical protein
MTIPLLKSWCEYVFLSLSSRRHEFSPLFVGGSFYPSWIQIRIQTQLTNKTKKFGCFQDQPGPLKLSKNTNDENVLHLGDMLRDEEEVEPVPPGDGVVDHGARGRVAHGAAVVNVEEPEVYPDIKKEEIAKKNCRIFFAVDVVSHSYNIIVADPGCLYLIRIFPSRIPDPHQRI